MLFLLRPFYGCFGTFGVAHPDMKPKGTNNVNIAPSQTKGAYLPVINYISKTLLTITSAVTMRQNWYEGVGYMYFCEIPTWTWIWAVRHLGSWELGPPSASEMAADLETLPMLTQTPQYRSCSTIFTQDGSICGVGCIQYLHMPLSVYLQSYVGLARGRGGIWRETRVQTNGFGSLSAAEWCIGGATRI